MKNFNTIENINNCICELEAKYNFDYVASKILNKLVFRSNTSPDAFIINTSLLCYDFSMLDAVKNIFLNIENYCSLVETYEGELHYYMQETKRHFLQALTEAVAKKYYNNDVLIEF